MHKSIFAVILTLAGLLSSTNSAMGVVTLELRPATQTAVAGQTFTVGLYAVANPAENVGLIDAIITWDANRVTLTGSDATGAFAWDSAIFPPDALNNSFADGDALFRANVPPCSVASASPAGLLVTTLIFDVGATTGNTSITLAASIGSATSRVFDGLPGVCPSCPTFCGVEVPSALGTAVNVTVNACSLVTECDDLDDCTTDACSTGVCTHTPNYDVATLCCAPIGGTTTVIDDANGCTADSCDATTGIVTNAPQVGSACGDQSTTDCTTPDTCDFTGVCQNNHRTDGTTCNSLDNCITGGSCSTGVCIGGTNRPDGTVCDDGLFCTGTTDTCTTGACGGTPQCGGFTPICFEHQAGFDCGDCTVNADCPPPAAGACITKSCNTINHLCSPVEISGFCPDTTFCNGLESCNATTGLCEAGTNPCTVPGELCSEPLSSCVACLSDTDCDDSLPCNGLETCDAAGSCQAGTDIDCSPFDATCEIAKCDDAMNGQCVLAPVETAPCLVDADCSPPAFLCGPDSFCYVVDRCSDGIPCTIEDICLLGSCNGVPPPFNGPIDMQWQPSAQTVAVGDTVQIDMFLVTNDPPANHTILTIEAVLNWDPAILQLTGNVDPCDDPMQACDAISCPAGEENWVLSYFPVGPADPDGFNNSLLDGDAFYVAAICPNTGAAPITPAQSLRVTTFTFTALAPTEMGDTVLSLTGCTGGTPSFTRIIGDGPGNVVTGNLGVGNVTVACAVDGDCDDNDCCTLDSCVLGTCNHDAIPGCQTCILDIDCDDSISCTTDTCVGGCCQNLDNCVDDGLACTGVEFCDTMANACTSSGDPCPGICVEPDGCPCEAPLVDASGAQYLGVTPQPIDSIAMTKLIVTSPDWPCMTEYAGIPVPVDINNDGNPDGMMAPLETDILNAVALMPQDWVGKACDNLSPACNSDVDCGVGQTCIPIKRCSRSLIPCNTDPDCNVGGPLETCISAKVYLHGEDIYPSELDVATSTVIPIRYTVAGLCGASPTGQVTVTMKTLGDINSDLDLGIVDIVMAIKGIEGKYDVPPGIGPFSLLEVDLIGDSSPPSCDLGPPLDVSIGDLVRVINTTQGVTYADFAAFLSCVAPCP